jgi:hypothetical protein
LPDVDVAEEAGAYDGFCFTISTFVIAMGRARLIMVWKFAGVSNFWKCENRILHGLMYHAFNTKLLPWDSFVVSYSFSVMNFFFTPQAGAPRQFYRLF